jgi:hypothetical protein
LIYGEFNNNFLEFNGDVTITGDLSSESDGVLSGSFAIGTASTGSDSDFQDSSDVSNEGFLTTPWIYTNAIEATGERGAKSTAIIVGDDDNFSANDEIHLVTKGISALMIDENQYVGIGTIPTNGRLEVSGTGSTLNSAMYGYLDGSGATGTTTSANNYSIYASGKIAAFTFHAHSDERIKDIQGVSDSKEDLNTLMNIKITDYKLKDKIANGDEQVKKVIAQQVKSVYPQAVTNNTIEVVPDIYQTATMNENGWIAFSNSEFRLSNSELKTGEKIQIIFEDKKELLEVLEIKENTFRVSPITNFSHEARLSNHQSPTISHDQMGVITVFVYGRQVTDFHTVDYEAISMLNVSATQELVKEMEQLKKENKSLKAEVSKIQQLEHLSRNLVEQNAEMKAMLKQIQTQLNFEVVKTSNK